MASVYNFNETLSATPSKFRRILFGFGFGTACECFNFRSHDPPADEIANIGVGVTVTTIEAVTVEVLEIIAVIVGDTVKLV
jgi:hypothetical protein